MTASTLSCGCDMPIPIYADWCQDQGWDADELRVGEEVVVFYSWYFSGNGFGVGSGYGHSANDINRPTGDCWGWLYGRGDETGYSTSTGDGQETQ